MILELTLPGSTLLRKLYLLYFTRIMPWIGGRISGDRKAYRYLPASVQAFPPTLAFQQMMREAGFGQVRHRTFSLGLCRMFIGEK